MFKYNTEQKVVEVAGLKCGGQPGEYPTVLAGTIFYAGHKIIKDELTGEFDKDAAEKLIKDMEEMEDTTGNPCIIQCFGATPEAIEKYLEFIGDISDKPFLIDSTSGEARSAGAQYVQEAGLVDRAIYNSINMSLEQEELDILKETDINASIILGFNPIDSGVMGKIDIWDNGGSPMERGLLDLASECGIEKFFMDTAVTPITQGGGDAARATFAEKDKWGYPVGSGIHNIPSAWDWLRDFKKNVRKEAFHVCDIGADLLQICVGGDFCLFGPIENSLDLFPAAAMADSMFAEAGAQLGTEPVENHPINKLF
ncbi:MULTISPECIES: tetrahydromethanopterin S-methyltransferase subunit H [unclassified Methanobrevibacter]|uniref:tetrahydromethanopterin S-methyltransferase subunit H n=1 Tax=unclassified Methanobrevibacter TaxID=2638681 RepID=UPI0039B95B84